MNLPVRPLRPYQILIVEDDDLIRLLVSDHLQDAGFKVIEASHAGHALALAGKATDAIDLVFTDIQMPGEMDGLDLAEYFAIHYPGVPVLITSGARTPAAGDKRRRFISKPYQLAEVERQIRELI